MKFSAFTYFAAFGIKTILFRQKKPILGTVILTDKCNLKCKLNIMYPIAGTNTVIRQPQWIKVR